MPLSFPLQARLLDSDRGLTLDGGLASELDRAGYDLQHELWSARLLLENPDAIARVIRDFADAGADIVATATYQVTFPGLGKIGLDRTKAIQLFQDAVALAFRAVSDSESRPLVAASIGPYGAFLADGSEYRGNYSLTKAELADFHRERIAVLTDTEADLLAFETFPSGIEIEAIADVLAEYPDREAWISCSCRNGQELWDGTAIGSIAERLHDHPQVTAIGVNCIDPVHAAELISRIRGAAPGKAVIAYPNAGRGWNEEAGDWKGFDSPEEFAERATEWRKAGASIVGGCCQTTPEHIRALAEAF